MQAVHVRLCRDRNIAIHRTNRRMVASIGIGTVTRTAIELSIGNLVIDRLIDLIPINGVAPKPLSIFILYPAFA